MPEIHAEAVRKKHLPRVGQLVRSKKHNTIWRVIAKKKVWLKPRSPECRSTPAVYLYYLRVQGGTPGIFKILGCAYTLQENTFEANWELIN
jgi:hypothetical protein